MDEQRITLEYLERYADELDRQMRELADKRDAVRKIVLSLRGAANPPAVGAAPDDPGAEARAVGAEAAMPPSFRPQELTGLEVDYTGATNLLSRLRCVGRAAEGGVLRVGPVAKLLIADGVSAAKFNNLRRSVDKAFRTHPEQFEYLEPGTYVYNDAPP